MRVVQTAGALLIGALFSSFLSGMVTVQAIIFYKTFPKDALRHKFLVGLLWALNLTHDACVWAGVWNYIVQNYRVTDTNQFEHIPVPISVSTYWGLSVHPTLKQLVQDFRLSHCSYLRQPIFHHFYDLLALTVYLHFFCPLVCINIQAYDFHSALCTAQFTPFVLVCETPRRWWIVLPILILAVLRMTSAFGTASQMIILGSFDVVKAEFSWMFSLGLALSSTIEIIITASFLTLFLSNRSKCVSFEPVIDSLILYSIETGAVTCAATISVLLCWLCLNENLVFLGLHFTIAKLYGNSVLATLNMRHELRKTRQSSSAPTAEVDLEVFMVNRDQHTPTSTFDIMAPRSAAAPIQVSITKSIIRCGSTKEI
ncbi:hypothetical protein CPB85DRAFT_1433069 [Mucidula mucida]|nr:hypothetical protein CPB85DRAFT_1433069 [Mucidula mucida]